VYLVRVRPDTLFTTREQEQANLEKLQLCDDSVMMHLRLHVQLSLLSFTGRECEANLTPGLKLKQQTRRTFDIFRLFLFRFVQLSR
jgi:hypothetical protein